MFEPIELKHYQEADGGIPFLRWIEEVEESVARRILQYVHRLRFGNFGDSKSVGDGVIELRLHFGPGYRVYYLREGRSLVLLLCGGDKSSQAVDIARAREYAFRHRRGL